MKNRKDAVENAAETVPAFGVGVQVYVREPQTESGEDWVGEPTGVIIAPGAASLRSVNLPAGDVTSWLVAFSEPQHRRDGRGPYEQASIAQVLLVAADPIGG